VDDASRYRPLPLQAFHEIVQASFVSKTHQVEAMDEVFAKIAQETTTFGLGDEEVREMHHARI